MAGALVVFLAGCRSGPPHAPAIGEAYVGPADLKIRGDIPLQSPTVATVKHGDRLEILQIRRRFLRVRTPNGAEGWTDERHLLAAADMAALRDLSERAAAMPVQGQATTYSDLNVHTQPARESPSFVQVKEKETVDVLAHVVMPRAGTPRKPLIAPSPKKPKAAAKKSARGEAKYPPPPMPKPPPPPPDWLDLSKTDQPDEAAPAEEEADEKPAPVDEWSLIRTASGQSGWVLTRRLVMAIPDEVAQYAEGHRIVSYFSLGETRDGDRKKATWLWTTIGDGTQPYDFDSFRVFAWSQRRHHYETAYIERNLKGYAPVLLQEVEFPARGKVQGEAARYPGFSICMEKKDGQRYRREYALLNGIKVRFAGEHPCEAAGAPVVTAKMAPSQPAAAAPAQPAETFAQRIKKRLRAITRRWFGG
ncbi:MAG: SH3 domain-containing protein [Bryobacteraceae bacterium]